MKELFKLSFYNIYEWHDDGLLIYNTSNVLDVWRKHAG